MGYSISSIVATYIIDTLSLMTSPSDTDDWPLYISSMPDGDAVETNCGAAYDMAGKLDGKLSSGEVVQHPGFSLTIRSDDYETGYSKIEEIALALDDMDKVSVNMDGTTYQIQNMSRHTTISPLDTQKGTKRRFLFVVSFLVTVKEL